MLKHPSQKRFGAKNNTKNKKKMQKNMKSLFLFINL